MLQNKSQNSSFNWTSNERSSTKWTLYGVATENDTSYGNVLTSILLSLFLVVSNSILLHTIVSNKGKTWAKQTKHIRYLIICDLVVGVTLFVNVLLRSGDSPYWLCALLSWMSTSTQVSSYYHMLAVCIHRFRKLRRIDLPNVGSGDTYRYGIESLLVWIGVLLLSVPPYVVSARNDNVPICRLYVIFQPPNRVISLTYIIIVCCLPCFLTNVLYGAVLWKMRIRLNAVQPDNHFVHFRNTQTTETTGTTESVTVQLPSNQSTRTRRSNKVNKIIGYLLLVFNISILGPVISNTMVMAGYANVHISLIQALTYVNNIFSPFIYSLTIVPLRNELTSTIRAVLSRFKSVIMCSNVLNSQ